MITITNTITIGITIGITININLISISLRLNAPTYGHYQPEAGTRSALPKFQLSNCLTECQATIVNTMTMSYREISSW